ncbi:MAG: hypothetical protein ACRDNW_26710, partial [Trebonia sp.]
YLKDQVMSDLTALVSAIEEATAGLAGLPAALASGVSSPRVLADGLARLDGAVAALRFRLGGLDVPGASTMSAVEGQGGAKG